MGFKPTELVQWNTGDEPLIARYVDEFVNILYIDSDGGVKSQEIFKVKAYQRILTHYVRLPAIPSIEVRENLIYRAFFLRLKKYKTQDVHAFRRALAAEADRYLQKPIGNYQVICPLHVAPGEITEPESFSVLGSELRFLNWDHVADNFDLDRFLDKHQSLLFGLDVALRDRFTPVALSARGRDTHEVSAEVLLPFHLFRTALNMTVQFGRSSLHFGTRRQIALARYLPPVAYGIFKEGGKYENVVFSMDIHPAYRLNTVTTEQIQSVGQIIQTLRTPEDGKDTVNLLIEALEKYGEALDTPNQRTAFLMMWQILELITLQSKSNSSHTVVSNRISRLLGQEQYVEDYLGLLKDTRNQLVHHGEFPDDLGVETLNLLKHIVERSINELLLLLDEIPKRGSLMRLYELLTKGRSELQDRKRIIELIQEHWDR